jgi:hypothetical protein
MSSSDGAFTSPDQMLEMVPDAHLHTEPLHKFINIDSHDIVWFAVSIVEE